MAIFEVGPDNFREIIETTFKDVGIKERSDLQRLLRGQIEIISPDTLVIAEEFGEWEDAKRRIDLLGVDKNANLVVIEMKRTEDGGHMDLQAVRYAAMVSTMTFAKVVDVFADHLKKQGSDADSLALLLEFLGWSEPNEDEFAEDVRIVLVSAEFSKELTTAVLWLNERDLDIQCIRIKPYHDNGRVLVDVQKVIPLPETADYIEKIGKKKQEGRGARTSKDLTKYDVTIVGQRHEHLPKNHAIFAIVKYLCENGVKPEAVAAASGQTKELFQVIDGIVESKDFIARQSQSKEGFEKKPRCFCDVGELIHYGGKTYAFTNQWGRETKATCDKLLKAFPDKQISIAPSS